MNGECGARCATGAQGSPSMCAGSAGWSSQCSALQEEIVAKKREDRFSKISCFFSNTNRFTQLGAHLIDPACPPQDDRVAN
jgi:hypothetical protein